MAAEKSTLITGLRKGLNWKNFFTCTALAMALLTWGYYAGIVATTVTKRTFLAYMDMIDGSGLLTADAANQLGAMSSIFQASRIYCYCKSNNVPQLMMKPAGWRCAWGYRLRHTRRQILEPFHYQGIRPATMHHRCRPGILCSEYRQPSHSKLCQAPLHTSVEHTC